MNFTETIRVIEKLKKHLIDQKETGAALGGLIKAEIAALNNMLKFTNLVLNHFPAEVIHKIINTDTVKNSAMIQEMIQLHQTRDAIEANERYENIYVDEIKLMPNYKVSFSMIEYQGKKYIIMEPKKMIKSTMQWENWLNFKFPIDMLKENQNCKRIRAINGTK